MKVFVRVIAIVALAAQTAIDPSVGPACTGITIKPKDGSIIFARTLEFAMDLKSNIIVVPRGKEYVGTAPGDKPGLRWKTKYGIVGTNAFDLPVTVDGLNEKGLSRGSVLFSRLRQVSGDEGRRCWQGSGSVGTRRLPARHMLGREGSGRRRQERAGGRGRAEGHGLRAGGALHRDRRQRQQRGSRIRRRGTQSSRTIPSAS